jgi:hypothetical protein
MHVVLAAAARGQANTGNSWWLWQLSCNDTAMEQSVALVKAFTEPKPTHTRLAPGVQAWFPATKLVLLDPDCSRLWIGNTMSYRLC